MKKLINLFEAVTSVAPNLYPYLDFPAKAVGSSTPASDKINDVLLSDINAATKAAGLTKTSITTAVSGHRVNTKSGTPSRHTNGTAVDIAIINGSAITKDTGDKLVAQLKGMGYDTSGSESGNSKAVLWQVADHFNHIHVSNTTGAPSTPGSVTTSGDTTTTSDTTGGLTDYKAVASNMFTDALKTGINKLGIQTESRLDKDINKIKKLLK